MFPDYGWSSTVKLPNLTYLLQAPEDQQLYVKEDENSAVRWLDADSLEQYVTEPWMMQRIYRKLLSYVKTL